MPKLSLAFASLILLAACASPAPPASPTPIPTATLAPVATAPGRDEYAVYDAIIEANGLSLEVIEAATTTGYPHIGSLAPSSYIASQLAGLQALVYYQNSQSWLIAGGYIVLLASGQSGWAVKKQLPLWAA